MCNPSEERPTVPRDEAFWNTYIDVRREEMQAFAQLECHRTGHLLVTTNWPSGTVSCCKKCNLPGEAVLADWKERGYIS